MSFPVTAGVTLELVLTRFWSTLGDVSCDVTIHFKGLTPSTTTLSMTSGEQISNLVTLSAELGTVTAAPAGKLDKWLTTVMPNGPGKVTPLGERDVLPSGTPLYQMILEYTFEQPIHTAVTPRWRILNGLLYDSPFHSQFYMIYNTRKVLMACGDTYPESCKLDKGTYTVRLQVRHESPVVLEGMNELPMLLERSLESALKLTCHKSQADASLGIALPDMPIYRGTSQSLFWKGPAKLPKFVTTGDVLSGAVTYLKKDSSRSGSGTRPGGFPVRYVVTTTAVPSSKPSPAPSPTPSPTPGTAPATSGSLSSAETPCASTERKFAEAIRHAKVTFVENKAGEEECFDGLYEATVREYPDYVRLRLARLTHLSKCRDKTNEGKDVTEEEKNALLQSRCQLLDATVLCASEIIGMVNEKAIAEELGCLVNQADASAVKTRKEKEGERDALVTALAAKCTALADKRLLLLAAGGGVGSEGNSAVSEGSEGESKDGVESSAPTPPVVSSAALEELRVAFEETYKHLQKWDNTAMSDKHWRLYVTKMRSEKK